MMSKTSTVKKSYSRTGSRVPRETTLVFDNLMSGNKNGKNSAMSSSAAMSVSRWGQTSFTSLRHQKELNGSNNNSNNKTTNSIFRSRQQPQPQVDTQMETNMDLDSEIKPNPQPITSLPPPKPKVYKFFKSKSSSSSPTLSTSSASDKSEKKLKEIVLNEDRQQFIKHVKSEHEDDEHVMVRKSHVIKETIHHAKNVQPLRCNNAKTKVNERKIPVEKTSNQEQQQTASKPTVMTRMTRAKMKEQEGYCEKTFDEIIASSTPKKKEKEIKKAVDVEMKDCEVKEVPHHHHNVINTKDIDMDETLIETQTMEDKDEDNDDKEDVIESIRKSVKKYEARKVLQEKEREEKEREKGKKVKGIEDAFDEIMNSLHEPVGSASQLNDINISQTNSSQSQSCSQPIKSTIAHLDNIEISSNSSSQPELLASSVVKNETVLKAETIVTTAVTKPKRRIFSSTKSSRSVKATAFNMKNFYAGDNCVIEDVDEHGHASKTSSQCTTSSSGQTSSNFGFDEEINDEDEELKLKRVKKANQCHDLGESEQFDGDIKFYLSGIESSNSIPMRCLSILGLSQQTMRPEFRLHLRAHDDMPKIISALMDAPSDPNLALCTATWLFCYNQGGRLNMDINADALHLMLQLLETRSDECHQVEHKHREKVRVLCEEMKKSGNAQYLNLNEITAGKLTMETLLGLTSKRANRDSIKDELRKLKGIDFIVNTAMRCADFYFDEGRMIKIDRCMHVLENVTLDHAENQMYILVHEDGQFIETCIKLLNSSKVNIMQSKHKVYSSLFFSILRVLTHLTSEIISIASLIDSYNHLMRLLLDSLFDLPQFIPLDQRFDFHIILLCLAINLVEFYPELRSLVMKSDARIDQLIGLLSSRIEEAQKTEQQADDLLESHEAKLIQSAMNEATRDSILEQILAKSGKHMEHSIIAACVSLLLGCCIHDNYAYAETLREHCPNSSFDQLVDVLQKFRDFAHLADIMTVKGKERVERIIEVFKFEEQKFKSSSKQSSCS